MNEVNIYRKSENGKINLIRTFKSYDEVFSRVIRDERIWDKACSVSFDERIYSYNALPFDEDVIASILNLTAPNTIYAYVVTNEKDQIIHPSVLVHKHREWIEDCYVDLWGRIKYRREMNRRGRKPPVHGKFRKPRTFSERKRWCQDKNDLEAPTPRAKRNSCNIPSNWDDIRSHNERSWKKQSKRKHQYKVKK